MYLFRNINRRETKKNYKPDHCTQKKQGGRTIIDIVFNYNAVHAKSEVVDMRSVPHAVFMRCYVRTLNNFMFV